jgi:hypothetical protein
MENTSQVAGEVSEISPQTSITGATPQSSSALAENETGLTPATPACTEIVPSFQSHESGEGFEGPEPQSLPEHIRLIPFRLELRVPLSRFTLRDLQGLQAGIILETEHLSVRDLVLTAAGERLLLVELEAMEQQLAARVKRLAWRHKWRRKA